MSAPKSSVFTYESTVHSCHVLRRLDEQRLRGTLCDVTVLVEGQSFRAHRSVLAACSDYFAHRITSLTQQGAVLSAPQEVTAAGFEPLLKFAYTSKLLSSRDNVADIRKSASLLGFRDLEEACFEFLTSKFSGGEGPAPSLRKTCCKKKCKRRLTATEPGTGFEDVTHDDREVKPVADSSSQQEASRCCDESANGKMESQKGTNEHFRQCPKYRRQLACEREICRRHQSNPAPVTEDNRDLQKKEEEESRRESASSASTFKDNRCKAETHGGDDGVVKRETNEREGEPSGDPRVEDKQSTPPGSRLMLAEGSSGLILNRCPLKTFAESLAGSLGEEGLAKEDGDISSACAPPPTPVHQKTEEDRGKGRQTTGMAGGALSAIEREVAEHLAQRLGSDLGSSQRGSPGRAERTPANAGSGGTPPEWLDLHLGPKRTGCSFLADLDQSKCPWRGPELSECEGASHSGLSSFNSGEDGDSGTETEGDSESYTRERAKEVQLPFPVDWVADLSRNEFQQLLKQQVFTRDQLEFVHDMRRRSKNRLAAQRCRKRKLDCIYNLQCEINKLKAEREKLIVEKSQLGQLKMKTCDNVSALCQKVCKEARLQPQQLQVLARYTSPECPLSSIFPHMDTAPSQPQAPRELPPEESASSSPDTLKGDCRL